MLAEIEAYRLDPAGLAVLVNNLEALIDVLRNLKDEQRNALRAEWGVLEDVYAAMLDEERAFFDQHDERLLTTSLFRLRKMVEEYREKESM